MTDTGKQGEQLAADFLRQSGYEIITTNWHCARGEIDIVARNKAMLIFVEVKTRRGHKTETAFASMTSHKRKRLIASAYAYLEEHALNDTDWRIDLIGVALSRQPIIEHVEDALGW